MNYLIALLLGAVLSFIGSLPPGVISMTVVENTIQRGFRAAVILALGAALVEGGQAFFALHCASWLSDESYEIAIKTIASILFLGLGLYSFYLAQKGNEATVSSSLQLPYFWKGVLISLLNVLAIPYWLVNAAYLDSQGLLRYSQAWVFCFCSGVAIGTFLLLLLYAYLSKRILANVGQVNKWTNIFLGTLFLILAGIQFWKLLL